METKRFTKKDLECLKKDLLRKRRHGWKVLKAAEKRDTFSYCEAYKAFISNAKTEREVAAFIQEILLEDGFRGANSADKDVEKVLWNHHGKAICAYRRGKLPAKKGLRIIVTHIDAPRLDLKLNPLYEEFEMAFLKTHYYGGIRKYQWVARPLALHGVVFLKDQRRIDLNIGEKDHDPVFTINDLLPHLAARVQGEKKLKEAIHAEKLNVLFGGIPINGPSKDIKDAVKLNVLNILNSTFGIIERDLVSAEIEIVPRGRARDVGIDKGFVGGYAQDDRACTYAALRAILDAKALPYPALVLFVDKEEIGSDGNTGAKSRFLELSLFDVLRLEETPLEPDTLYRALDSSRAISGDVTAGIDPNYTEVHEERNDALIGHGVSLTKYTGVRGKYSANDAHAELVDWITRIWDKNGIVWQAGEMGKVDEGGGGTVAKYIAALGVDTVDVGPPLLSMHSPFEVAHKCDLFMTYKAYKVFLEND